MSRIGSVDMTEDPTPASVMREIINDDPFGLNRWLPDVGVDSSVDMDKALSDAKTSDVSKREEARDVATEVIRAGTAPVSGMTLDELAYEFYNRHTLVDMARETAEAIFLSFKTGDHSNWSKVLNKLQKESGAFFDIDNLSLEKMRDRIASENWVFAHAMGKVVSRQSGDLESTGWCSGVTAHLPDKDSTEPVMCVPNPDNPESCFHMLHDENRARAIAREIIENPRIACLGDELAVYPERFRRSHLGLASMKAMMEYISEEVNPRIADAENRIRFMVGLTFRLKGLCVPRLSMDESLDDPVMNLPSLLLCSKSDIGGILCWRMRGPDKSLTINTQQFCPEGVENEEVVLKFEWDAVAHPIKSFHTASQ